MSLPMISIVPIEPSGRKFSCVISGDLAERFKESYRVDWKNMEAGGQAPHWTTKTYDRGSFDRYTITFTLFPGLPTGSGVLDSASDVVREAEYISNLSKPVWNNGFCPPPLCLITIGNWWAARGYIESVDLEWEGAKDEQGRYSVCHVSLSFDRHVGRWMQMAKSEDLRRFTYRSYSFRGG